jgi:hypothetical protein
LDARLEGADWLVVGVEHQAVVDRNLDWRFGKRLVHQHDRSNQPLSQAAHFMQSTSQHDKMPP